MFYSGKFDIIDLRKDSKSHMGGLHLWIFGFNYLSFCPSQPLFSEKKQVTFNNVSVVVRILCKFSFIIFLSIINLNLCIYRIFVIIVVISC